MNYIDVEENKLGDIRREAMRIASEWDGDQSGIQEDRAMIAGDILEAIRNLEELLSDLDDVSVPDEDLYKDSELDR
jgi:phage host-nuclease inhibitor protein Gam